MGDNNGWIIIDGTLSLSDSAIAPAGSRALMYGEGVFETLHVYKGHTLLLVEHLERLKKGLSVLGIEFRDALQKDKLSNQIFRLLKKNSLLDGDAIVRLQVWRDGQRGYFPKKSGQTRYVITAGACPNYKESSTSLATVSIPRIPTKSLPNTAKFTNSINYILAAKEAVAKGKDHALMLTINKLVSETTIANIFWVRDNVVYTPSDKCDLLPGITRGVIITLLNRHKKLVLNVGEYSVDHLYQAEAVGICNSVREFMPVQEIDCHHFDINHPVLQQLREGYANYRDQNLKPVVSS